MKKLLLFTVLLSFVMLSCDDEEADFFYADTAEVLGLDATQCACCGDFVLQINNSNQYRAKEYPDGFQDLVDSNEIPFSINLNYTLLDNCSTYIHIKIDDFELIE